MNNPRILFSKNQIDEKILEIAKQITMDYSGSSGVVLLSVLKGSFIFAADLVRELKFDFEIEFVRISSYRKSQVPGKILVHESDLPEVTGRPVIILEDILDTGNTITALHKILIQMGARSVSVSALLVKKDKYKIPTMDVYGGFEIPDHFVVGYGLDYAGKFRNLPYIGILQSEPEQVSI